MSGHNKWSKIKNVKEKNDQQNAKMFTKIGREIAVAVKLGGPDPNANTQLKNIIAKAKSINMPNDNINRSIKKASGELNTVNYESMTYEGYGIGGSAVIVYALTDNKNRTASDVRHLFDKFGGSLGSNGCVSYLFTKKGVIYVQKGTGISDDDIMMMALDAGAEDILIEDDVYEIYTTPDTFDEVRDNLEKAGVTIADSGLDMIPSNYVTLPEDKVATFQKMIDFFEDSDDVQEVYHNVELPDEE
jgi:YebC/PmpR family DNA-binding regulatory protein